MTLSTYADHDALGLAELVRNGETTPAELVEAAIERIERHNPTINAVVHKAYDEARATAKADISRCSRPDRRASLAFRSAMSGDLCRISSPSSRI